MNNPRSIFTAPDDLLSAEGAANFSAQPPVKRRYSEPQQEKQAPDFIYPSGPHKKAPSSVSESNPQWTRSGPAEQPPRKRPRHNPPNPPTHHQWHTSSSTARAKHTISKSQESVTSAPRSELHRQRPGPDHHLGPTLEPPSFNVNSVGKFTPPSPLFFSNSPQPRRPRLPPRFSSSEAAAKMLSKTKGEDTGITTVTLARGNYAPSSPPDRAHAVTRRSADRGSIPRTGSSEISGKTEQNKLLNQVGVIELLEQDERPTFIVDLGDIGNTTEGHLPILFSNSALRRVPGLLNQISAEQERGSSATNETSRFQEFKDWVLSTNYLGDYSETHAAIFLYGIFSWSCSTLRRRLRVVKGHLVGEDPSHLAIPQVKAPVTSSSTPSSIPVVSTDLSEGNSTNDYFGNVPVDSMLQNASVGSNSANTPQSDIQNNVIQSHLLETLGGGSSSDLGGEEPGDSVGFFDWTRLPVSDALPKHIQFARSIDWASTALGPIEDWSADLRQMCNLIMASPHPAAMYWGDDLVAIYNEAYVLLAGQKHPSLMGQSYRTAWAEIWDEVKDVFASARETGKATLKDDDCLFITRGTFLEETYFSWSIIPLVGGNGAVQGLYNPAFEKTRRKIAERRMLTLREVGERTASARDVKAFWTQVLAALDCNVFDTPMVLLYSISDDSENDSSSVTSNSLIGQKQCYLEGSLGVPAGHIAAPDDVDLRTSEEGFVPHFREVLVTNRPSVLDVDKGEIRPELLQGMEWRGFGDAAKSVVVCPIHTTTGESTLGFLVMGVNPRRLYDDDYNLFVQLLSRQLATSLASVVLFEEEIKRGQRAAKLAAMDRIELSEQLAIRTQEARDSETKFTRMAEFAPVGMFSADSEGRITYCNDTWYEISRVPKETHSTDTWMDYVIDQDKPLVKQLWHEVVTNTKSSTGEIRFKAPWTDPSGEKSDTWVLFSACPEKYERGALKSIFGCITNISQQKWAEGFQKRKMEEAVELKRQQENFIDITSHEMRNPLSAILQSADEIITSLTAGRDAIHSEEVQALYDGNIDAAQTISLCAQHQKRIVDDILTLSKLDSALLMVTPVDVQPISIVTRAMKMFEGELQTSDIQLRFDIDNSYKELGVDWVKFDPSRVLQVLINLTTNAIKFTSSREKRGITITISASKEKPSKKEGTTVKYFTSRSTREDITERPDWGDGEPLYIEFSVQDTGRGLTLEERKMLFLRFSQASPRTHVQYGGSGLGLFISRELSELQGGEIGVASESGTGSTFAFFVKATRAKAPENPEDHVPPLLTKKLSIGDATDAASSNPATQKTTMAEEVTAKDEALKVLIVEDNLVNQRVLKKQLLKMGCVVHVANHGGEALEQLRASTFWVGHAPDAVDLSVVLMDQEMPVMDGLTCTKKIRELEREGRFRSHVPVIAVTANARHEQVKTLLDAGTDDVVSKPFRIPELIPKMAELVAESAGKVEVLA